MAMSPPSIKTNDVVLLGIVAIWSKVPGKV